MAAPSASKTYTITHAWQSGRDLRIRCGDEPVYWIVFHTMRIGNICTLSIHERAMYGSVLCAGVLDRLEGFSYKTAGQRGPTHHLLKRGGLSIWEQEYRFKPAKGAMLAWKQAKPGQAIPQASDSEQGYNSNAPAMGQRDWILVAVNEHYDADGNRNEAPDKVLAAYSAPRGISQHARIYFVEELGTQMEVGALAVILGIVRWNCTKPGKLLTSAFGSAPAFLA